MQLSTGVVANHDYTNVCMCVYSGVTEGIRRCGVNLGEENIVAERFVCVFQTFTIIV